ncbi:hypothetical protein L228DRAFT_25110 [Xylona heveae TC161]|uniref:Uncharacterized protein n=1 Tax=Xylona heveae (strain CBS 132557 / TC161) TaxID=1328760 RepID=A0A165ACK7_XYLHT|nr:hypothetical protein L228DRAFT_25110 [Xylona heveae TC161]KZF20255.1 hypothetical protein L228DRAFT_25110 [Xylona heveae TC161]
MGEKQDGYPFQKHTITALSPTLPDTALLIIQTYRIYSPSWEEPHFIPPAVEVTMCHFYKVLRKKIFMISLYIVTSSYIKMYCIFLTFLYISLYFLTCLHTSSYFVRYVSWHIFRIYTALCTCTYPI